MPEIKPQTRTSKPKPVSATRMSSYVLVVEKLSPEPLVEQLLKCIDSHLGAFWGKRIDLTTESNFYFLHYLTEKPVKFINSNMPNTLGNLQTSLKQSAVRLPGAINASLADAFNIVKFEALGDHEHRLIVHHAIEKKRFREEIEGLRESNQTLQESNQALREENHILREDNQTLRGRVEGLEMQVNELSRQVNELSRQAHRDASPRRGSKKKR